MSSMHMPWYARSVFTGGRPLVLVAALVMSVPGEIRMAQLAGWQGWITWLMPVSISAYAACAAVISEVRRRAQAPGRITATIGAGAALGLALSAQVVAHLIDGGYMATSAILVAVVSAVPPLVVAHMLHMAATPPAAVTAEQRIAELEETLLLMTADLAESLDLEGRVLVSKAHGVKNTLNELAEEAEGLAAEADELAEGLIGEVAAAGVAKPKPRRNGNAKQAVPLAVVKETVAAMLSEGAKVNGKTLAGRLGCSERTGYRYLGAVKPA
ncbi:MULTISPECIES: hypothetical protein [unclassified Streptomyces]|uniref:hypothetical protein n=1 Tax=unclassified Streptomyces TaxID=2593676 RepID=UPI0003742BAC|nr:MULTISPECIES: hypothetical protein [unclassified Streptomyces]MYT31734.1 hypothetical protein [Streptomyces sp. SID8354]